MSECVAGHGVVVVGRVVHVVLVSQVIGVSLHVVVGVVGEEEAVPGAVLLLLLVLLVAERLIVRLHHCALCDVHLLLGHHGGEGLVVGACVPLVALLVVLHCVGCKEVPTDGAGSEEVQSEGLSGEEAGVEVHEVVDEAIVGHDGHSTLEALRSLGHPDGEGGRQEGTQRHVREEGEGILIFDLSSVSVGPSLRARHRLSRVISNPRIV